MKSEDILKYNLTDDERKTFIDILIGFRIIFLEKEKSLAVLKRQYKENDAYDPILFNKISELEDALKERKEISRDRALKYIMVLRTNQNRINDEYKQIVKSKINNS